MRIVVDIQMEFNHNPDIPGRSISAICELDACAMNLDFYLDYRSPFAYMANIQLKRIAVTLVRKPIEVVSVMKAVNNQPSTMCPSKARYAAVDAARCAKFHGAPFVPNGALLGAFMKGGIEPSLLSRVAIAAQGLGIFDQVNDALFAAVWAGDADLLSESGRRSFLAANNIEAENLWEIAETPEVARQLAEFHEEAVGRGVFGVPTFFVGSEMFFGNDRLNFVEAALNREIAA